MTKNPSIRGSQMIPDGYEPVHSNLEGITVFARKSKEDGVQSPKNYKCPKCGAATKFDINAGGVACDHCGFISSNGAEAVGTLAEEHEFTLDALNRAEKGWGISTQEIHCDSCGADLAVEPKQITSTCVFCTSNMVNIRTGTNELIRPKYLIPFKVRPEIIRNNAATWLGQGWFHPNGLSRASEIGSFQGIYLPFWTFDAILNSEWKAEVGHPQTQRYFDAHSRTWKTRTTIIWRWENGQENLVIDDLPVVGSTHISSRILERILPFNMNELVKYSPDFLAGWKAHNYDSPLLDSWEKAKTVMREKAKSKCRDSIHSGHIRNFSVQIRFSDESWRYILLPVYLTSYKHAGKVFQVMANGQSGKLDGQKPVAWEKVWLAVGALLSPGLLLLLIGLPLLLAGGLGVIPLFLGLLFLVIGGIIAIKIFQNASESEKA